MSKDFKLRSICYNSMNFSDDSFVGLKFNTTGVNVYFPIGYNIPDDDNNCRLSILNLIRTIALSNSITQSGENYSVNTGNNNETPINSFLWILSDYLKNNLYTDKEKIFKRGQSGKINWKKTMSTNFYVSGKNIVFLNPYTEKNMREDTIITDIHAYCVGISIKYIGWLFGNFNIPSTSISHTDIKYYINVINKEIFRTFDDKNKALLMNLKKILEFCGGNNKNTLNDYGIHQYEHVWEYMVSEVFGNEKVENYFPSSSWHILDWKEFADSKLRPDTILTINESVYILDSKYYKFGVTGNPMHLPHTDSIQKQITYGEHISINKKFNFKNIYNAFVIPYNKYDNKFSFNENIKYIGFAESNWKENKCINLYEHISLIMVDTKYLIDCYFKDEIQDTETLVKSIENVYNTFK